MAKDDKTKTAPPKKEPVVERKIAEVAPKTGEVKTEGAKAEAAKTDAAPKKQGLGEGQKPVTQVYKDNWNAIFGEKKKKR